MIIRNVDSSSNDWVFGKGKNDYKKDQDALEIDLKTRLQEWKYDCFFDLGKGVDYKSFMDKGTKSFLDGDIKRVINQTEGVLRIDEYDSVLDTDNRQLTTTSSIYTIFGDLETSFLQKKEPGDE